MQRLNISDKARREIQHWADDRPGRVGVFAYAILAIISHLETSPTGSGEPVAPKLPDWESECRQWITRAEHERLAKEAALAEAKQWKTRCATACHVGSDDKVDFDFAVLDAFEENVDLKAELISARQVCEALVSSNAFVGLAVGWMSTSARELLDSACRAANDWNEKYGHRNAPAG